MGAPRLAFPWVAALWALLLASLGSAAGQPLGAEPMCTAQPLARYSITFTGKWSQASFPKQYPLFRPPAQWSSLLGECSPRPVPGAPRGDQKGWLPSRGSAPLTSVQEVFAKVFRAPQLAQPSGPWWGRVTQQGAGVGGGRRPWVPLTQAGGVCPSHPGCWVEGPGGVPRVALTQAGGGTPQGPHTARTTACGGRTST